MVRLCPGKGQSRDKLQRCYDPGNGIWRQSAGLASGEGDGELYRLQAGDE
jgi:hypothetical protein